MSGSSGGTLDLANLPRDELRQRLVDFAGFRYTFLKGDEKGEAQVFLERLFIAFGYAGLFQAGATLEMRVPKRDNGGTAFADLVWKPRVLIEMKKGGEDLSRHYRQAFDYWIDLVPDRPQFVVLCNFDEFWVYDLNQQLEEPIDRVALTDLAQRWEVFAFLLPQAQEPVFGNDLVRVTREAASKVAGLFNRLVARGVQRPAAQRFILQALMAMFAEDIGLLPGHLFQRAIQDSLAGESAFDLLFGLFREMNLDEITPAGRYKGTPYFNGGLFRAIEPIDLEVAELETLHACATYDWREVRPAIFGTLFEQSLDKEERHAYGAHFTSEVDIHKVVQPTLVRPWRERIDSAVTLKELHGIEADLLSFRVLDPACGCGNFLYVGYRELRRLERSLQDKIKERSRREGARQQMSFAFVSPRQFFGIDINSFATEIAKVTLMLAKKLAADELDDEHRVLPLDDLDENIVARDALDLDWPSFDACIGNPPYLGRRKLVQERGAKYAAWLAERYPTVSGVSDYVVYWFLRAQDQMPAGGRAGFVATNAVRRGDTSKASLEYVVDHGGAIYDAVSSQPWSGDAAVHVSIINWIKGESPGPATLWMNNGSQKLSLDTIGPSLSPTIDLRAARKLAVNTAPKVCFEGQTVGDTVGFVLTSDEADELIAKDANSRAVVHPYLVGDDLLHAVAPPRFLIDLPESDIVQAQAVAPGAFARLRDLVLPRREEKAKNESERNATILMGNPAAKVNEHHRRFLDGWWQLSYRRAEMLEAVRRLPRYIALSRVSSELRLPVFEFVDSRVRPSDAIQVFAFADEYSFGILQSALHATWFRERCSTLETRLRYTASTVFDSFPWPQAPAAAKATELVDAVVGLLDYREAAFRQGIPLADQYDTLKLPGKNVLRHLHQRLDEAVVDLYGFDSAEDQLAQLLGLNQSIAEEELAAITRPRSPGAQGVLETPATTHRYGAAVGP